MNRYTKSNSLRLFRVWQDMRRRCNNPSRSAYEHYGGRGIKVCEEWDDFNTFATWAYDNGYDSSAPRGTCTIDRIDNDSDYTPDNCRFVNMKTQSRNRRTNTMLTFNGETMPLTEWAEKVGLSVQTIASRIKREGWSVERALTTPPRKVKGVNC